MDLATFSSKRKKSKKKEKKKKRKKKKKKEEKDCRERHLCFKLPTRLTKPIVKKERRKEKKERFLKSHNYLFGHRLLKFCYMLNASLMLKSIGCVVYLSSCLLLPISVSASYRFHLFSLNVLFALKTLQWNF